MELQILVDPIINVTWVYILYIYSRGSSIELIKIIVKDINRRITVITVSQLLLDIL